jgi:probable rRNA maturation factor
VSVFKIFFEDTEIFNVDKNELQKLVFFVIKSERKITGEISVIFCSDEYLLKINEQYLGHDYYTDIVTFDYVENSVISGDLFVSVDRVLENAGGLKLKFEEELYRVIFHGILHLCGYKDKTNAEKKAMREKEDFYLEKAGFKKEKK